MTGFFIDFIIVAILIIAITATNGVILNGIGTKLFGGKKALEFVHQSNRMQTDWKNVGGKKRSQKWDRFVSLNTSLLILHIPSQNKVQNGLP